jgi:hypothetical protein
VWADVDRYGTFNPSRVRLWQTGQFSCTVTMTDTLVAPVPEKITEITRENKDVIVACNENNQAKSESKKARRRRL